MCVSNDDRHAPFPVHLISQITSQTARTSLRRFTSEAVATHQEVFGAGANRISSTGIQRSLTQNIEDFLRRTSPATKNDKRHSYHSEDFEARRITDECWMEDSYTRSAKIFKHEEDKLFSGEALQVNHGGGIWNKTHKSESVQSKFEYENSNQLFNKVFVSMRIF